MNRLGDVLEQVRQHGGSWSGKVGYGVVELRILAISDIDMITEDIY